MLYSEEIHPLPELRNKLRDGFLDRRGADDASVADFDEGGTFCGTDEVWGDHDETELVGGTIVRAIEHQAGIVNEKHGATGAGDTAG